MHSVCTQMFAFVFLCVCVQNTSEHQGAFSINWWPWDRARGDPWSSEEESCPFSNMIRRRRLSRRAKPPNLRNRLPLRASPKASALWITPPCRIRRWWSSPKRLTFKVSSGPSLPTAKSAVSRDHTSSSSWAGVTTDPRVSRLLEATMTLPLANGWKKNPCSAPCLSLELEHVWSWYVDISSVFICCFFIALTRLVFFSPFVETIMALFSISE